MSFIDFLAESSNDDDFIRSSYKDLDNEDIKQLKDIKDVIEDDIEFEVDQWDLGASYAPGTLRYIGKNGDKFLLGFAAIEKVDGKKQYKMYYVIYNLKGKKLLDIQHHEEGHKSARADIITLLNSEGSK